MNIETIDFFCPAPPPKNVRTNIFGSQSASSKHGSPPCGVTQKRKTFSRECVWFMKHKCHYTLTSMDILCP